MCVGQLKLYPGTCLEKQTEQFQHTINYMRYFVRIFSPMCCFRVYRLLWHFLQCFEDCLSPVDVAVLLTRYQITDVYFRVTWFRAKATPAGGKTDVGVLRLAQKEFRQ